MEPRHENGGGGQLEEVGRRRKADEQASDHGQNKSDENSRPQSQSQSQSRPQSQSQLPQSLARAKIHSSAGFAVSLAGCL